LYQRLLSDQITRLLRNPWLLFAVVSGIAVSLILIIQIIYGHGHKLGADFEVFWKAARAPISQVYVPHPSRPFVYPPTALPFFEPLIFLPFWPAFVAWSIGGLALYRSAARASGLLLISPVIIQCLVFGQTALLLGAIVLFAARKRGLLRGAMIGIVFALKPQLVILAPLVFAARRDWFDVLGLVAASGGLGVLSIVLYGPDVWVNWVHALPAFRQTLNNQELWGVVVTPFGYATKLGLDPWPIFGVCLALAIGSAGYIRDGDPVEIVCLTSLLATPYAGGSDLAPLLPFAFKRLIDPTERVKVWIALVYGAAFTPIAAILGLVRLCLLSTYRCLSDGQSE
jgi:hypothetical protein